MTWEDTNRIFSSKNKTRDLFYFKHYTKARVSLSSKIFSVACAVVHIVVLSLTVT